MNTARKNGYYTLERWDENRGLWIDIYEARSLRRVRQERLRLERVQPAKYRIVYATADAVLSVL